MSIDLAKLKTEVSKLSDEELRARILQIREERRRLTLEAAHPGRTKKAEKRVDQAISAMSLEELLEQARKMGISEDELNAL